MISSMSSLIQRTGVTRKELLTEIIAGNLGQYGGGGSHVTSKMAPKQYKKMYGKRFFFQNSCLRMEYSFTGYLEMQPASVKASIATKKKYSNSSLPFPKVYD